MFVVVVKFDEVSVWRTDCGRNLGKDLALGRKGLSVISGLAMFTSCQAVTRDVGLHRYPCSLESLPIHCKVDTTGRKLCHERARIKSLKGSYHGS